MKGRDPRTKETSRCGDEEQGINSRFANGNTPSLLQLETLQAQITALQIETERLKKAQRRHKGPIVELLDWMKEHWLYMAFLFYVVCLMVAKTKTNGNQNHRGYTSGIPIAGQNRGSYYTGQMNANNHATGYGQYTFEDGFHLQGLHRNGEMLQRDFGSALHQQYYYIGGFENAKRHGFGMLLLHRDHRYQAYFGQFDNNQRSGFGEMWHPDGTRYKGWFAKNQCHGQGTLYHATEDGGIFVGEFVNGTKHGEGYVYWPKTGVQFKGVWNKDEPVGDGTYYTPVRTEIKGPWVEQEEKKSPL